MCHIFYFFGCAIQRSFIWILCVCVCVATALSAVAFKFDYNLFPFFSSSHLHATSNINSQFNYALFLHFDAIITKNDMGPHIQLLFAYLLFVLTYQDVWQNKWPSLWIQVNKLKTTIFILMTSYSISKRKYTSRLFMTSITWNWNAKRHQTTE